MDKIVAPDVAAEIWRLVCEDFGKEDFMKWDEIEKERPWYRFCKQLEIDIKMKI